jgi:radical SAM protein with 4Fe4S-binding SPASM domain
MQKIQRPPLLPSAGQILNVLKFYTSIAITKAKKKPIVLAKPVVLMLEPTTACQLKCPHCPTGRGELTRNSGTMNLDNFKKIWDSIRPAPFILQLWNQGEPLVSKDTPEIIRHAAKTGGKVILSTNVELLAKNELAEEIVKSGLYELILSLDGATAESHVQYRVGGDFKKVEEGIKNVVAAKKKYKLKYPILSWQFLLFKHNLHEVEEAKRLAKEWGVDRVVFKTAQLESFEREEGEQWLPEDPKLRRYDLKGEKWVLRREEKPFCKRILGSMVVEWNGEVVPCCFDKDGEFHMGNIIKDDFDSVWFGDKYYNFRYRVQNCIRPKMCANCTEGLPKLYSSPK